MPRVILVVDDEPTIVALLSEMLQGFGLSVAAAGDAYTAVSTFVKSKPALAILDYNMPAGSGGDVYQSIRKLEGGDRLPVIFLSAVSKFEIQMMAPESPWVRFLSKPIDLPALKAALEEFLGPLAEQGAPAQAEARDPGSAQPAGPVPAVEDLAGGPPPGPDAPKP